MKQIVLTACVVACGLLPMLHAQDPGLDTLVQTEMPGLLQIYYDLHRHPELSRQEERTSSIFAEELSKIGYIVTERVGIYPDGERAYGVVGVLTNGPGLTLMLRTDLDALPVEEMTGLSYASQSKGVMHACGHDVHIASMIGDARVLAKLRNRWHGTLIILGQPAEETTEGAQAMLSDHLYDRFGTPDFILAEHDTPDVAAGQLAVVSGPFMASSTFVNVQFRGISGHGALPDRARDPIVMAAEFIVQLQTIVSRAVNPLQPAVVTVGSIHGGTRGNIIPDSVQLQISTRAFDEQVRQTILSRIGATAAGVAEAQELPATLAPIVTVEESRAVPATINDPALAARIKSVLVRALGPQRVTTLPPSMVAEDFSLYSRHGGIPALMLWVGAADPTKFSDNQSMATPLPALHSSLFSPVPEPTIRTGVTALVTASLELLH